MPPTDIESGASEPAIGERIFLVVADDTGEMPRALHYACRRARATGGRVALVRLIEPVENQPWMALDALMQDEMRAEAEALLQKLARQVMDKSGKLPILFMREGQAGEALFSLIAQEPRISTLVLAADEGDAPGPLVNYVTGKGLNQLRVPVTLIPGGLSEAEIDAIS